MTVYYLGRGANNNGSLIANPFPKGLKMLSGNSFARTQDLTTMTWGNSTYPPRLVSEAVSMVCINYDNESGSQTVNITNMNCPDGFRAQIQMQSCWDGVNLYLSDQSHVAYLSQIDNGMCPPTHPILLPHLFYEVFYSVTGFEGGDGTFVFANGDETGFGFHGDFINGWDIPTLEAAISECLIGNADGVVDECPAFDASNNDDYSALCPERQPVFPCEPVHGTIAKLPGCINGTGYGAAVTAADVTCPGGNAIDCGATYAAVSAQPYSGGSNYSLLGCYTEATNSRALTTKSYVNTTGMTAEACISFCGGSQYVGVEYAQECYCGSVLQAGSVPANATDCDMDCTGNRWELCGGPNRLNIFSKLLAANTTASHAATSSATSLTISKVTTNVTTSKSTTSSATSATTSKVATTSTSKATTFTAATTSSTKATTTSAARTTSSSASPLISFTTTSILPNSRAFSTNYPNPLMIGNSTIGVWKNQGCWTDNTGGGRVLTETYMYGDFMGSAPMTLEMCGAFCGSSKINATFFGVEYQEEVSLTFLLLIYMCLTLNSVTVARLFKVGAHLRPTRMIVASSVLATVLSIAVKGIG